jgi:hypothetical protein
MKKQPLLKLIEVLNELGSDTGVKNSIVEYLDGCGCCAFCKNFGQHDPCDPCRNPGDPLYEDDFDAYDKDSHCGYFLDKRKDGKYQPPNGTVLDFYKDIVKEVSTDHQ